MTYIHELADWPNLRWSNERLAEPLAAVRHRQGRLIGRMEAFGFPLREEAVLRTLTEDVVKSSEIEGEVLDRKGQIALIRKVRALLETRLASAEAFTARRLRLLAMTDPLTGLANRRHTDYRGSEAFKMARLTRDAMLAIPDRLAAEIAAETDTFKVHTRITEEIRKALESLGENE